MGWMQSLKTRARQLVSGGRHAPRPIPVVTDPCYRVPLTTLESRTHFEPRRADFVAWWLHDRGHVTDGQLLTPPRLGYGDLARVHTPEWLEALGRPEVLARVLGVEAWDVDVDVVLPTFRAACGGTLLAARLALASSGPAVNLLGGFHHAYPDKGAGLCPLNDLVVAIAVLRSEGFAGRVAILDLDAHPPDGTAACLAALGETQVQLGSLSGSDWGPLPGVDETVLDGADDARYLDALDALLRRLAPADLTFVIAGGDVLAGDPMGKLRLTLPGVWERDDRVATWVEGRASVWVPAGGYTRDAWQVLAGACFRLITGAPLGAPLAIDPLIAHFRVIQAGIEPLASPDSWSLDAGDLEGALGFRRADPPLLLGHYSREALEAAFTQYGILGTLERLGYRDFALTVDLGTPGDRLRLRGRFGSDPTEHLLVETSVEVRPDPEGPVLFIHWLTLRHPKGAFAQGRPPLPGQDTPGLGLAREAGALFGRLADRLGLVAVALRPMWFHVAYACRDAFQFRDPRRQGRFDALLRDLHAEPALQGPAGFRLPDASMAVADGRVWVERAGEAATTYVWEPDELIAWTTPRPESPERSLEASRVRFGLRRERES